MNHMPRNDLDAAWMPFTANRSFKAAPRLLARADGMLYWTPDGREVLDATAGLWCVNAGHNRRQITEAITRTASSLDFAPTFQMGHPLMFEAASRIAGVTPAGLDRIFFTNSGSESADTALKIALAYHRANGQPQRTMLIGRERGYHGINFGGLSVGGIGANRKQFAPLLGNVDHLPHTHLPQNRFAQFQPEHGAEKADALIDLVQLHGADSIAAVIVEPVAGSTGVLVPPVGYLEKLRALCDQYGILLIFDEVITGFGRMGAPFAAERFGVTPDILTMAKGLTNAAVPMGAVAASDKIYRTVVENAAPGIELFHGYTYSGHPLACAAAIATLDIHRDEELPARARAIEPEWREAVHSLRDRPGVVDIRDAGLIAGIELEPFAGRPAERAGRIMQDCFEKGLLIRTTADTIALSPPLILERSHIDRIVTTLGEAISAAVD